MNVITIPRKLAQQGGFVVLARGEYEEFLALRKMIPVVTPTRAELRAIARSEKEIREGKYISWHELKKELADTRHRGRAKRHKAAAAARQGKN